MPLQLDEQDADHTGASEDASGDRTSRSPWGPVRVVDDGVELALALAVLDGVLVGVAPGVVVGVLVGALVARGVVLGATEALGVGVGVVGAGLASAYVIAPVRVDDLPGAWRTTSTTPGARAGVRKTSWVLVVASTTAAALPTRTSTAEEKPCPVTVTVVPPVLGTLTGLIVVTL